MADHGSGFLRMFPAVIAAVGSAASDVSQWKLTPLHVVPAVVVQIDLLMRVHRKISASRFPFVGMLLRDWDVSRGVGRMEVADALRYTGAALLGLRW
jgi:hypothetical protein